jgi:succinoglycan biosynthesis transport protein ExoP
MNRLPAVDASMALMLDDAVRQSGPAQAIDQLLRAARREWKMLLLISGLTAAAAGAYLKLAEPHYTAEAIIMAAPRQSDIANTDAVSRAGETQLLDVEGELQIMNSPASLARVVQELGLAQRAERLAAAEQTGEEAQDRIRSIAASVSRRLSPSALDPAAAVGTEAGRSTEDRLADQLGSAVQVSSIGRSTLARIRLTATDPALAAEAANAVAENYLANRVRGRQEAAERAAEWLQRRAQELRAHVLEADQRVAVLRLALQADGRDLLQINAEMTGLGDRILQARVEKERATNRLASAEALIQRTGILSLLDWETAAGGDRHIDRLRSTAAEASQEVGRLSVELGSESLALRRAQAQRRVAQGQMEAEARARFAALQADVSAATALSAALEGRLQALRRQANDLTMKQTQLEAAQLEGNANRAVYETFLARLRTTEQVGFNDTDGWLLSPATVPAQPTWPKIPLVLAAAFIAGLGLCMTAIGFREFRQSRTLRSNDDVTRQFAATARYLGHVPELRGRPDTAVRAMLAGKPRDFVEAVLGLQDKLGQARLDGVEKPRRGTVIAVISALPQEGKSTILACIAAAAAAGQKVAVVDCDLHSTWQQGAFDVGECPGVSGYLSGRVDHPRDAGRVHEASGVFVLPAGHWDARLQAFSRSPRLPALLHQLRSEFDIILIDTPPMLVASDARALCALSDTALLVARWGRTPAALARYAQRQIEETGTALAGVVLTRVNMARFATFDFPTAGAIRRGRPALIGSAPNRLAAPARTGSPQA